MYWKNEFVDAVRRLGDKYIEAFSVTLKRADGRLESHQYSSCPSPFTNRLL